MDLLGRTRHPVTAKKLAVPTGIDIVDLEASALILTRNRLKRMSTRPTKIRTDRDIACA